MSAELLFADTIDISSKRDDTPLPVMREGFYLWLLKYVKEKPRVVSLEKPCLMLEASC